MLLLLTLNPTIILRMAMASVMLTASAYLVSVGALVLAFQNLAEDDVPEPLAPEAVAVLATLSAVSPK